MDIKEYSKLIKAKRKELDDLMKRKMPVIAGRMAKDHFQDNFRREGFVNGGLHPWPKAKRLSSGRTDAAGQYGALLSGRNHLFSSVKYVPGESGQRPHIRSRQQLGRRSASDRYATNAALCVGEVLPGFRQG